MNSTLYLDTARLGRMNRAARLADRDFARLVSREGASLYFEQFLQSGFYNLPPRLQRQYPHFEFWDGIGGFKRQIHYTLGTTIGAPLFVASRSRPLVELAAEAMARRCKHVLTTDLEWPVYVDTLKRVCRAHGTRVTTVRVRQLIFEHQRNEEQLTEHLCSQYAEHHCDGLFLSAVTYTGLRMPIRKIVRSLRKHDRPRFVVVDANQALNHVPVRNLARDADMILTGCHKWLGAYYPLSIAVTCRPRAFEHGARVAEELMESGRLDDGLLRFIEQLEANHKEYYSETVNLGPVLTAAAAMRAMHLRSRKRPEVLSTQIDNAVEVSQRVARAGWKPQAMARELRTGILLLRPPHQALRELGADGLRREFHRAGIVVTSYDDATVRVSLPLRPLRRESLDRIGQAFARVS